MGADQNPALHAAVYALAGVDKDLRGYINETIPCVVKIDMAKMIADNNHLNQRDSACLAIALSVYNPSAYPMDLSHTFIERSLIAGEALRLRFAK